MNWYIQHFTALVSSIGLSFDIVGAWLVAWEVVIQYKGPRYLPLQIQEINIDAKEQDGLIKHHPLYSLFEANKYRKMAWGLVFLTLGFILQMLPYIIQLFFQFTESGAA